MPCPLPNLTNISLAANYSIRPTLQCGAAAAQAHLTDDLLNGIIADPAHEWEETTQKSLQHDLKESKQICEFANKLYAQRKAGKR